MHELPPRDAQIAAAMSKMAQSRGPVQLGVLWELVQAPGRAVADGPKAAGVTGEAKAGIGVATGTCQGLCTGRRRMRFGGWGLSPKSAAQP